MSLAVIIKDAAAQDLDRHADYLSQPSMRTANRFAGAVESSLRLLAEMPTLGAVAEFPQRQLRDVRIWPVRGFRNYLIFYRIRRASLEVLRVLHGAQDIGNVFEDS